MRAGDRAPGVAGVTGAVLALSALLRRSGGDRSRPGDCRA